ncbi:MAG: LPS assembly lipoprotein LptE [Candidatus Symbiodolus clandestinus]
MIRVQPLLWKMDVLATSNHQLTRYWLICGLLMLLSGCGFQSQTVAQLPQAYRTLIVQSSDPYSPLTRAVQGQLRQQGFTVIESSQHPTLQLELLDKQEERSLRSLFTDGKAAQYQLVVRLQAQLHWLVRVTPEPSMIRSVEKTPLATVVSHTFFDNPQAALAASVEQQLVQQQLYQQAAHQLVHQLMGLLTEKGPLKQTAEPSLPPVASAGAIQ